MPTNFPTYNGPKVMGGGDNVSYVEGDMLKQVSTPVETLLGAVNGALGGAVIAGAASSAITFLQNESRKGLGPKILNNMTGSHKLAMIGVTVALGALGAVVRNARATKHNEWSERQYAIQQATASHAERVQDGRDASAPGQVAGRN